MFSGISQWSQISAAKPSIQKIEEYIYCKWTWDCLGRQHMLYNLSHISTCFQYSVLSKYCGSSEPSVKWMAGETLHSETQDTSITLGVLVGSKILSLDCKEVLCECSSLPFLMGHKHRHAARPCHGLQTWHKPSKTCTPSPRGLASKCGLTMSTNFSALKKEPPNHNNSILCTCTFCLFRYSKFK